MTITSDITEIILPFDFRSVPVCWKCQTTVASSLKKVVKCVHWQKESNKAAPIIKEVIFILAFLVLLIPQDYYD